MDVCLDFLLQIEMVRENMSILTSQVIHYTILILPKIEISNHMKKFSLLIVNEVQPVKIEILLRI